MERKTQIRQEKLALRKQMSLAECALLSSQIESRLTSYLADFSGVIANYSPINNEVIVKLSEYQTCLPVISKSQKPLEFRLWQKGAFLEKGELGIMQPPKNAPELSPDIIIVPIVAFDRQLNRIGYGSGYYDATIAALRKTKQIATIGVAFSFQEVPKIPAEPFDEKLDIIITEKELVKIM